MSHLKFYTFIERNRNTELIFDAYFHLINNGEWLAACREVDTPADTDAYSFFLVRSLANKNHFAVVTCVERHDMVAGHHRVGHKTKYDSIRVYENEQDALKFMEAAARTKNDSVTTFAGA